MHRKERKAGSRGNPAQPNTPELMKEALQRLGRRELEREGSNRTR